MMRNLFCLFCYLALRNASNADAFTPTTLSSVHLSSSTSFYPSSQSASRVFSSSQDDELSKLIGKRSQIRRKKKDELPNEETSYGDLTSDSFDTDDIDWESMPEFKTKRTKRQPKKIEEDEESKPSDRGYSDEPSYLDYLADHDDENDFHIPNRLGVSTRCWGDEEEGFVPSGKLKKKQLREGKFVPGDLQMSYNRLLEEGILLFETSPAYGRSMANMNLSSEDIIARFIKEYEDSNTSPLLVDTFDNKIWQRTSGALTSALTASCEKLEQPLVDVYQTKNIGWLPSGGIIKGMGEAVIEQGTTNFVGVQDISPLRMRRLNKKIESLGISIATNSFEFSLTDRKKEKWIAACKTLGVIPLIRNPLGSGLASGQYTASNPSGGVASAGTKFTFRTLEKYQPLHSVLESVAERVRTRLIREKRELKDRGRRSGPEPKINTDITTTQVAWNYVVAKGAVPLAEVNSPKQAEELVGCLGWSLNDDEVSILESAAELCS
eukprot:CAMPEP_0197189168 /NCGR_PEP_ID=MMETSP1423-20130617/19288_1 /TAXON_ID=476441 /ORGANISM="Pseudo-nitzschia heimii, Strain UNC1101" /LENGTH=493 /DNA_ID=CAMNT_0042641213 /DNA_START=131 /DNA_END=1615 /DNA_ORIENTATION=+